MTRERWQQINAVLDAVLDQPPGRRRVYLDTHCRNDPELRQEVLSLLEAHEEADSFLEDSVKSYAESLIPMADEHVDDLSGQSIGGYDILEVLGRGGMGVVYKARDVNLDKLVALKMINPALARDAAFTRKFRAEARALARIDSRHIVRVHAMPQTDTRVYIVMEFVDGGTLTDLLRNGAVTWQRALPIIDQMLLALEHAHSVGVIHRDIKPSNIMLTERGLVKVADFGLAKLHEAEGGATVTQGIAGTLFYMSPEQVEGAADLNHRSDLYSMGMTIYQMLTGRLPFDPDSGNFAIMRAIVEDTYPPPSAFKRDLPKPVADAVMKALEKKPDRRYQSAGEMRAAFEALRQMKHPPVDSFKEADATETGDTTDERKRKRRRLLWGSLGTLGLIAVALLVYLFWPPPSPPPPASAASLTVRSTPDAASVYLGGAFIGTTPLLDHLLDEGVARVALRIEKAEYVAVETTLVAEAGASLALQVPLEPIIVDGQEVAAVQVTSTPGNAGVQINGRAYGTTDANGFLAAVEVPPGPVTVVVTKNGHKNWEQTLQAEVGETLRVPARLETDDPIPDPDPPLQTGTLLVQVEGRGSVSVGGESSCRAGASCTLPAGSKQVTCSAGGFQTTRNVLVVAGRRESLTCYTEQPVVVQVRTEDGALIWAKILVDGVEVAEASARPLHLDAGTHRIEVQREFYDVLTPRKNVEVKPVFEAPERQLLVFQIRAQ